MRFLFQNQSVRVLGLIAVFAFAPYLLFAQEIERRQEGVEEAEDHPMISRYEGSVMLAYEHADYDLLELPAGDDEEGEFLYKPTEGEVTRLLYAAPEGLSVLQVHRNYQMALQDAGFEIVEECVGTGSTECNYHFRNFDNFGRSLRNIFMGEDGSYFLARKSGAEGDVYVSAHTLLNDTYDDLDGRPVTALQIVEEKPMATGKVEVNLDAEAMAEDLEEAGTTRLYGIHFDTGEATIKPESESTLAEIAELLNEQPDLTLAVVGHTDSRGSLEQNMELSHRRAEAVAEFLATEHEVAASRLNPHGVGYLSPVAANETEDGRARNRRVELVKVP
ncbi:MAG: OmpA family protein [Salinibacter sp.]|uniref:OmpA family protein n=1 Tax=Salinibacter sp. TaxID=2065818 RepID=UPI002FC30ADD